MGKIITFYSYKGGVGRSMTVANVGVLLSQWGYNVLLVDFDLEAPGLHTFFRPFIDLACVKERDGVVDFLDTIESREDMPSLSGYIDIELPRNPGSLSLWSAGKQDKSYFKKLQGLNFRDIYSSKNGGKILENLRNNLKQQYDFVLIDSRTGLTDIGGVCTVQMPDLIVLLFTPTNQAFEGGVDIVVRAASARQRLPFQRPSVPVLPIPSRFDTQTEYRLAQKWLDRFAIELKSVFAEWLPSQINPRDFLEVVKLPHISYFGYGESLPAIEQGTLDPSGLGYAYENLAGLLARGMEDIDLFMNSRDKYIGKISKRGVTEKTGDKRGKIFISYSHSDKKWLELLQTHLKPLASSRDLEFLIDATNHITPGTKWRDEINTAIGESNVAVLLVSPDYLASDLIYDSELPLLLKAAGDQKLKIVWIALRPSLASETPIAQFQAVNDPNKPLSELDQIQRDRLLMEVAKRISEVAGKPY
jgi:cellulose biosynthesis protein BcsQ